MMELTIPYSFYGANLEAYRCREPEYVLEGPADTGKTLALVSKLHHAALKYKDASIVICRKQLTDIQSSVMVTYLKEVAAEAIEQGVVAPYGGNRPAWFDYYNGARVWVAGLDKPGKVLSAQHDLIYVNQAEELSLADWETVTTHTTGRAGHMPYNQTLADCNPGPPSHWIKQRERKGTLKCFHSTHLDNPEIYDPMTGEMTEQGKTRLAGLQRLTGSRYKRLFQGLWAAPEGAIYEVFDEAHHKVKAFPIPAHWPRWVGVDPLGAYTAAVWAAWDPQNRVLNIYQEYYQPFGIPTRQHAENVLKMSRHPQPLAYVVGAPSERQMRADWQSAGVPAIEPPYADVWVGIDKVNELLTDNALVIHDNCEGLLSEIGDYRRKVGRDGLPTDTIENKEQMHGLDALRYVVAWLTHQEAGAVVSYEPVQIGRWG
jgi:phage terminase large subunit